MSDKLKEQQECMRNWIGYLSMLEDGDIDQRIGHARIAIMPDSTIQHECGMCIGAHYTVFSGRTTRVRSRTAVPFHNPLGVEGYNPESESAKRKRDDWYRLWLEDPSQIEVHRVVFTRGIYQMVVDLSEFYSTETGLKMFAERLSECIVDSTEEFPLHGLWSLSSLRNRDGHIPAAFQSDPWPCSPVKVFKLYAKRHLGMEE